MHTNSLTAHRQETDSGKFSKREEAILGALRNLHLASDREIMTALGFSDMNAVRPRLTELIKRGTVSEYGAQIDPVTKKKVRLVRICHLQTEFAISA